MSDASKTNILDGWGLCDLCMQTLVSVKELCTARINNEWGRWIDLEFWNITEFEECSKSCLFCAVIFNNVLTRDDDALSTIRERAIGTLTVSLINIYSFFEGRRCWLRLG